MFNVPIIEAGGTLTASETHQEKERFAEKYLANQILIRKYADAGRKSVSASAY
jgi:hypothetical protein